MQPQTPQPVQQSKENGLAIVSLVLGIVSITLAGPITGIPAIITGLIAMKNPHNKGMGVAGLIMGIISTVIAILALLFFLFLFLVIGVAASSELDSSSSPNPFDTGNQSQQQRI